MTSVFPHTKHSKKSAGFTIVELLLFLGIVAGIGAVVIGLLMSTQDARLIQRTGAEVEAAGTRTLLFLTRTARRAERIVDPPAGETGSVLVLQMASSVEFPTVVGASASGQLILIRRTDESALTPADLRVSGIEFRNTSLGAAKSLMIRFTITGTVPIPGGRTYEKEFVGAVTLFPDDVGDAGGCGSCVMSGCVMDTYHWAYCEAEQCVPRSRALMCE